MNTKNYLLLCAGLVVVWSLALVLIPTFAETIEQGMLWFLSTNAR